MAAWPTGLRSRSSGSMPRSFDTEDAAPHLEGFHAILVPGGFGERGTEGKIKAAQYAREHKVPYLGICLGMQMAVIEAARNARLASPRQGPEEFDHEAGKKRFEPVVYHLKEWVQGNHKVDAQGRRRQRRHHASGGL